MRRTPDNALWAKDAHLASQLAPAASLDELQRRCPLAPDSGGRRHLNVMRVPKAGSTSFTDMIASACGKSHASLSTLWAHEVRPADTCAGQSVTVIREPCERLVSQYRHFEILWGLKLKSHWVRHAPDADAFVGLLRQHWSEIYGNRLLPFSNISDGSLPRNYLTTGREKHDVTLLPQALWVGNFTYVICLDRLAEAMPTFMEAAGCRKKADFTKYANHEVDLDKGGSKCVKRPPLTLSRCHAPYPHCTALISLPRVVCPCRTPRVTRTGTLSLRQVARRRVSSSTPMRGCGTSTAVGVAAANRGIARTDGRHPSGSQLCRSREACHRGRTVWAACRLAAPRCWVAMVKVVVTP